MHAVQIPFRKHLDFFLHLLVHFGRKGAKCGTRREETLIDMRYCFADSLTISYKESNVDRVKRL